MKATKETLVEELSNLDLSVDTKSGLKEVVNTLFDTVEFHLQNGDKVFLAGFGTFEPKTNKARKGRNPSTGEPLDIPESKTVRFKVSKTFKESLNE